MIKLKDLIKNDFSIRENTSNLAVNSVFKDLKRGEKQKVNEKEDKEETNKEKNWSTEKIAGFMASIGAITIGLGNLADAYFLTPESAFLLNYIGGYSFGVITQAGNILIGSAALLYIAGIAEKYNIINVNLKRVLHIPFFSVENVFTDLEEKEDKEESKKKFSTKEVAAGLAGNGIISATMGSIMKVYYPLVSYGINFYSIISAGIILTASSACLYLVDFLKKSLKKNPANSC
jgi:hypothetical protein